MSFVWCFSHVRNTCYTIPRKDKFVLIVCKDSNCMGFLVNTTISQFIRNRPYMLACQVALKASDYWFLRHDSYLDCSQLFSFDDDDLLDGRGPITDQTKAEVKKAVAIATTIEQRYQNLIAVA